MKKLQGKHILITGASRGLGRQLVTTFAQQGAARIAITARDQAALDAVRQEVEAAVTVGGVFTISTHIQQRADIDTLLSDIRQKLEQTVSVPHILTIPADLTLPTDVERVVATTLNEFNGRLDVIVNNASALGPSPMPYLLDYPLEDFHRVLNTNLIAPFLLIKKLLPAMIEEGGSIINVTSDAGITGYPGWGAYGISKFGLEGLSQTWAAELENTGVRVNWVDPGNMNTAMHRAAEPEVDPTHWADPAKAVDAFVYLASDESHAVNGQRLQAQEAGWGIDSLRVAA